MPKLLDTDCTFNVVLKGDQHKDNPPSFTFKALSARQFNRVSELYETVDEIEGESNRVDAIFTGLREGLVGWKNMGIDYDPDKLMDILTIGEGMELMYSMLSGQQVSADEAKN